MDTTTNDGKIDDRSDQLLTITVAGKTDVGKTAIIQTFTYDPDFGESKPGPDVTRKVECKPIQDDDHKTILEVCDSSGLHHITEVTTNPTCKLNPHFGDEELKKTYEKCRDDLQEKIPNKKPGRRTNQLIKKLEEYKQDLSVLNHITNESDLVLFVVNVSQEPTKDDFELALGLSRLATPVIPVMNFDNVLQNYKNDWEILFGKYFQLFATFDAFNLCRPQIKILRNQITAILKTRDPKKAGVFADWANTHDEKYGMQIEETISLITNLILDSANCGYKKNIPEKEQEHHENHLKEKLLEKLITLESVCHETIIKKLGFQGKEFKNLGRDWEGLASFEEDKITNKIRRLLSPLRSLWILGEDDTGDLAVFTPFQVLEDLLGRSLEVAVLFLQRGHAKSKQKGGQERLEKKRYELDETLKENLMGNSLLSKVHEKSKSGKKTQEITSESPDSRWRVGDKEAFDNLRKLIRDELRRREESQEQ